jgi:hypothetical protein
MQSVAVGFHTQCLTPPLSHLFVSLPSRLGAQPPSFHRRSLIVNNTAAAVGAIKSIELPIVLVSEPAEVEEVATEPEEEISPACHLCTRYSCSRIEEMEFDNVFEEYASEDIARPVSELPAKAI